MLYICNIDLGDFQMLPTLGFCFIINTDMSLGLCFLFKAIKLASRNCQSLVRSLFLLFFFSWGTFALYLLVLRGHFYR